MTTWEQVCAMRKEQDKYRDIVSDAQAAIYDIEADVRLLQGRDALDVEFYRALANHYRHRDDAEAEARWKKAEAAWNAKTEAEDAAEAAREVERLRAEGSTQDAQG